MSETTRSNQKTRWAAVGLMVAAALSYAGLFVFIRLGPPSLPVIIAWWFVTAFAYKWGRQKLGLATENDGMSRRTKIALWIGGGILALLLGVMLWGVLRPHPGVDGPYPLFFPGDDPAPKR